MEGWGDKEGKQMGMSVCVCVCMRIRCQGGRSWLVVPVGVMLCHKLRNELVQKGWN